MPEKRPASAAATRSRKERRDGSVPEQSTVSPAPSIIIGLPGGWRRGPAGHATAHVGIRSLSFPSCPRTVAEPTPEPTGSRASVPRLVLVGATVLDADGARPRSTVVIEDRRIATGRTGGVGEAGAEG